MAVKVKGLTVESQLEKVVFKGISIENNPITVVFRGITFEGKLPSGFAQIIKKKN